MLNKLDNWHKTTAGLLGFGLAELIICYGFASLAIDRGNLWWYLLTLIFLIGAIRNLLWLLKRLIHV